jgi:hypothetical protein
MIYKVKLEYSIRGLGTTEQTTFSGLSKGDKFNFGNSHDMQIKVLAINSKSATLKFVKVPKSITIPGGKRTVELGVNDSIAPMSTITPATKYEIKILAIWEEDEQKLRYL